MPYHDTWIRNCTTKRLFPQTIPYDDHVITVGWTEAEILKSPAIAASPHLWVIDELDHRLFRITALSAPRPEPED